MKRTTLEKAHISRCSQVVLFAENSSETKDATTVFMVKILQKVLQFLNLGMAFC
jgi:uncharacterized protein YaeQ